MACSLPASAAATVIRTTLNSGSSCCFTRGSAFAPPTKARSVVRRSAMLERYKQLCGFGKSTRAVQAI